MASPTSAQPLQTGVPNSNVPIGTTADGAPVIIDRAWRYFLANVLTFVAGAIGYSSGQVGSVVQATNKSTGVMLNFPAGIVTLNDESLASGATATCVVSNKFVQSGDVIIANLFDGYTPGAYLLNARSRDGVFNIELTNISSGPLGEPVAIAFAIFKASK